MEVWFTKLISECCITGWNRHAVVPGYKAIRMTVGSYCSARVRGRAGVRANRSSF